MNNWNCASCVYHKDGLCHRYPPQVIPDRRANNYGEAEWIPEVYLPWTTPTDFCGEWKEIPS